ncbi:MAG: DUF4838 domain-containing protein [Clostridia bacterium]|nr:DUF4838 domain-containing protein [Clostridia bacterium]MBQ8658966.1 DUF4838 domain-containing protein [Clostridia bacterium]
MKRNIFRTFLCGLLSVVSAFLCCCQGTNGDNAGKDDGGTDNAEQVAFQGTHVYTATERDDYMVKNGASDYVLVVPEKKSATLQTAQDEFLWLFEKATGVLLKTTTDSGLTHTESAKYISLGNTALLSSASIQIDRAKLGVDGGRIVTKDNTVYLFGGEDKGTLYMVYTFMQINFGFEQYFKDCYDLATGITNLKMRQYDVTDIPDIAYRVTYEHYIYTDASSDYDENNFAKRMRMDTTMTEPMLPIYTNMDGTGASQYYHNTKEYLPEAQYGDKYDGAWYSDEGLQLCFTAHGNQEAREEMAQTIAQKIEVSLQKYTPDKYPQKNIVTFTAEDGNQYCSCEACVKANEIYGSHSGALVQLVNRVGELVEEWMNKEENVAYKRDDLKIITFAYNATTNAPCKQDENGEWQPIDESVKMRSNVGVFLAPIQNIDYQSSIYDKVNDAGKKNIDAWGSVTDSIYFWTYSTNFHYYCYMYDSFDFFNSEGYAYLASTGAKYLFNQPQTGQTGTGTAWHNLKMYLESKLAWDCSLNTQELVDKWFNAMFADASDVMKKLYTTTRSYYAYIMNEQDMYVVKSIYNKVEQKSFWPFQTLQGWLSEFDKAWEAIEKYKTTDPELYKALYYHIGSEWISPAYITLKLYRNELSATAEQKIVVAFKDIVKTTGMGTVSEHNAGSMQEFAKSL